MFLFFGWGCVIWQPLALQYGKRPVYLFSMLATLVSNFELFRAVKGSDLGHAVGSKDLELTAPQGSPNVVTVLHDEWSVVRKQNLAGILWLAHRVTLRDLRRRLGKSFGSCLGLLHVLTNTQYFTHERGKYMGLYALFLLSSNILAPVSTPQISRYAAADGSDILWLYLRWHGMEVGSLLAGNWMWIRLPHFVLSHGRDKLRP